MITKNGIVYKRSGELLKKYQSNEIEPVYEKAIGSAVDHIKYSRKPKSNK
jgi:hypothetical protein